MESDDDLSEIRISLEEDDVLASDEDCNSSQDSKFDQEKPASPIEAAKVVPSQTDIQVPKSRIYMNKAGGFATGVDLVSDDSTRKLAERAERFGLKDDSDVKTVGLLDIQRLYKSLNVAVDSSMKPLSDEVRLDAIHIRGVDDMSTQDVIHYFRVYGPSHIEWIDDTSCNVCWEDKEGAVRAMIGMSIPMGDAKESPEPKLIENAPEEVVYLEDLDLGAPDEVWTCETAKDVKETDDPMSSQPEDVEMGEYSCALPVVQEKEDEKEEGQLDDDSNDAVTVPTVRNTPEDDYEVPTVTNSPSDALPSGFWRKGVACDLSDNLILRFAFKSDRKQPGSEQRSKYYRKYGNPNRQDAFKYTSQKRKRKFSDRKYSDDEDDDDDRDYESSDMYVPEKKYKPIRMRMEADDEEVRIKRRRKRAADERRAAEKRRQPVHDRLSYRDRRSHRDQSGYASGYSDKKNDKTSIYDRLGPSRSNRGYDEYRYNDESDYPRDRKRFRSDGEASEEETHVRSYVMKPSKPSEPSNKYGVWDSLAKEMADPSESDLRSKLQKQRDSVPDYRSLLLRERSYGDGYRRERTSEADNRSPLLRERSFEGDNRSPLCRERSSDGDNRSPLRREPSSESDNRSPLLRDHSSEGDGRSPLLRGYFT